ncbi:MAG: hypothetical protein QOE70_1071 [Chthoniobacter sp.]|nr:hypothetical protein [Chthoniobacter sp.]
MDRSPPGKPPRWPRKVSRLLYCMPRSRHTCPSTPNQGLPPIRCRCALVLMNAFFILLISAGSLLAALPDTHPLRHPKASVITRPLAWWPDGGILINQVIRYILASEDEATAARALLDASGYGANRDHYLWVSTAQDASLPTDTSSRVLRMPRSISEPTASERLFTSRRRTRFRSPFLLSLHPVRLRCGRSTGTNEAPRHGDLERFSPAGHRSAARLATSAEHAPSGLWSGHLPLAASHFLMESRTVRGPARTIGTSSPSFKRRLPRAVV